VGGITVTEPAADLAVALAVASMALGYVIPSNVAVFGELGLAGEIRTVPAADRRLAEAARAGFTRVVVPPSTPTEAVPPGLRILRPRTLDEALDMMTPTSTDGSGARQELPTFTSAPASAPASSQPASQPVHTPAPGTMPPWLTVAAAASR